MILDVLYLIGVVVSWPFFAVTAARGLADGYPAEGLDYMFGVFIGTLASLFWPAGIFCILGMRVVKRLMDA